MTSVVNRRLKSWPSWLLMLFVVVVFVVIGSTRSAGPQSQEDRVDQLTQRIACPVCDGESVFESQNTASRGIRNQVEDFVRQNELSDDEILALIDSRNEGELLLVPKASGLDALVWVLPAAGFVVGVVGLALAFRRWRDEAAGLRDPTDDDRAIVAAALADEDADDTGDDTGDDTDGERGDRHADARHDGQRADRGDVDEEAGR